MPQTHQNLTRYCRWLLALVGKPDGTIIGFASANDQCFNQEKGSVRPCTRPSLRFQLAGCILFRRPGRVEHFSVLTLASRLKLAYRQHSIS